MSDIAETNQVKTEGDDFAVEEDESNEIKNNVHSRLRANSSIMQLKKILGMLCSLLLQDDIDIYQSRLQKHTRPLHLLI